MKGYLKKKSPKFPYPYQRRYFRIVAQDKISGPHLGYYESENNVTPKGIIRADDISEVAIEKKLKFFIIARASEHTGRPRCYHLAAADEKERDSWVVAIKNLIDGSKPGNGSTQSAQSSVQSRGAEGPRSPLPSQMQPFVETLLAGLRHLVGIVADGDEFQSFAKNTLGKSSYFDVAVFAPIFRKYFNSIMDIEFDDDVKKFTDIIEVDLERERFLTFLDYVEENPNMYKPRVKVYEMEDLLKGTCERTIISLRELLSKSESASNQTVSEGLEDMINFFTIIVEGISNNER